MTKVIICNIWFCPCFCCCAYVLWIFFFLLCWMLNGITDCLETSSSLLFCLIKSSFCFLLSLFVLRCSTIRSFAASIANANFHCLASRIDLQSSSSSFSALWLLFERRRLALSTYHGFCTNFRHPKKIINFQQLNFSLSPTKPIDSLDRKREMVCSKLPTSFYFIILIINLDVKFYLIFFL